MAIPLAIAAFVGRGALMAVRLASMAARTASQAAKQGAKAGKKANQKAKQAGRAYQQAGNQQQEYKDETNFKEQTIFQTKKDKEEAHQSNLKEINRMTDDIQKELIQKIQKQIGMDDITFTGNLRKNIKGGFWGSFKTVEADTPYAYFVEFGLPPGKWVNFDALRLWVEGKLGISEEEELNTVTWKILRKINNKGIKPKRFMKKGIKALIAKRGVISTRGKSSGRKQKSAIGKFFSKVSKLSKTINKYVKKADKFMGKVGNIK
jgi:hypothetical protein